MDFDLPSLKILRYPDPLLRKAGKSVEAFDASLKRLATRMFELMRIEEGIGLAAPQVGILLRMFVCNVTGDPKDDLVFLNPKLADLADPADSEEGCLSIPEVRGTFQRYMSCRIIAQDLSGKAIEMSGVDLAARCWQHEYDHLEGRLILDRFSEADKIATRRRLKELESKFTATKRTPSRK